MLNVMDFSRVSTGGQLKSLLCNAINHFIIAKMRNFLSTVSGVNL